MIEKISKTYTGTDPAVIALEMALDLAEQNRQIIEALNRLEQHTHYSDMHIDPTHIKTIQSSQPIKEESTNDKARG